MDEKTVVDVPVVSTADMRIEELKQATNWFLCVQPDQGEAKYFDAPAVTMELRQTILSGEYPKGTPVIVYSKNDQGQWSETKQNLISFARGNFGLRVLYEPVWAHAMKGISWGLRVGAVVQLLFGVLALNQVNPMAAFLLAVFGGALFIPKAGGPVVGIAAFWICKDGQFWIISMALTAMATGAILGCLPGMAVGGIVGIIRAGSFPQAAEGGDPSNVAVKAVLLPMLGAIALFAFHIIIVEPWALRMANRWLSS